MKKIEVFLVGGINSGGTSMKKFDSIIQTIKETKISVRFNGYIQLGIAPSDTFGVFDEERRAIYSGKMGILYAAFDEDGNPHVKLGFTVEGYNGDYNKLQLFTRLPELQYC